MAKLSDRLAIIFVHGMSSKPPEKRWFGSWRDTLVGSVALADRQIGRRLADDPDLFHSAYWADAVPDHLPDSPSLVGAEQRSLLALINLRRKLGATMHISADGWGASEARRFGVNAIEALSESLRVAWDLRQMAIDELHRFHTDPTIAARTREPLEEQLRKAWDADRRVVLITHSLGTTIAFDTLWRFTHRRDPGLGTYRKKAVDLFVTMGSPLGNPGMRDTMLCAAWLGQKEAASVEQRRRAWPGNIRRWHNYSALGDVVCHSLNLESLFFESMRCDLKGYSPDDFRDYRRLYNPYREPGGVPNPHKDFGYLVQPKLASQLCRFVTDLDRSG